MKLDAYIRVSRVLGREGPSYISPDVQREQIERWALVRGVEIAEWFVDEDWSGGASNRPGLDQAVQRAISGESEGIVSARIDRFSRATEHGLRDLRRLQEAGARLVFVAEDVDTGSPVGKLFYTLMLAQAEYFLDQIKASWRTAKARATERGAKIGPTPVGYRRGADGVIEPHPVEAPTVVEVFRRAADGDISGATAKLQEIRPSSTAWHLRRLLRKRTYLGEQSYGDLLNRQAHEPLVSREVWERAQPGPEQPVRASSRPYPLSRLASCTSCGEALTGATAGAGIRVYRCSSRAPHESVMIKAEALEQYLIEQLAAAVEAHGSLDLDAAEHDADLDALYGELVDAERELSEFAADPRARKLLGAAAWSDALEARAQAVDEARSAYQQAARASRSVALDKGPDELRALPPEDMREVFAAVFAQVLVGPSRKGRVPLVERVRVVTHGDAEAVATAEDAG